jgi:hypothetical protein
MTDHDQLQALAADLTSWLPMREFAANNKQFSYPQLKALFWQAEKHPGLSRCSRVVGKRRYIHGGLFGLFLSGLLPEQQANA